MDEFIKSEKPDKKFKVKKPDYSFDKREKILVIALGVLIVFAGAYVFWINNKGTTEADSITTFEQCAAAGNPIMESYPEQCAAAGKTFVKQY